MKKALIAFFSMALAVMMVLPVSASAPAGLNENEQRIMELIRSKNPLAGREYIVPVSYANQAENFFLQVDVTAEQADEIIGYIQKGIDKLKLRQDVIRAAGGDVFNLRGLAYNDKKDILEYGQKACAVVGLNLIFDGTNVVITDAKDNSKLYFSDAPIIKVTGMETSTNTAMIVGIVLAVIAVGGAVALVIRKRRQMA